MRVILVEDSEVFRTRMKQALRGIPGTRVVMEAASAADAREWLRCNPGGWDLALVDLFLKESNGFEVLGHCARDPARQKVAVVSNYTREPVRAHVGRAGADAFFDKSLELEGLIEFCAGHATRLSN